MFALWGMTDGNVGSISAPVTGGITGDIDGDVEGDLTGDVLAADGTKVIDSGTDGSDATGNFDVLQAKTKTPVNAVASAAELDISGDVIEGEYVTIGGEILEFTGSGALGQAGAVAIDISGDMTKSTATLTQAGVALDAETVTINSRVYEADAKDAVDIAGDVAIDINEATTHTVKSQGLLTMGIDLHGSTLVVAGTTTTLKGDGTAGSATIIDMEDAATAARAVAILTIGDLPADGEIFTIGTRTYEFDPTGDGIGGSDVEIDTNGLTTIAQIVDRIELNYNADGSASAVAVSDNVSTVTFTQKISGVAGNVASTETMGDSYFGADLFENGADATAVELGALVLAHYGTGGAGEEATVIATTNGTTDDEVLFTAIIGGVAGDAITTTHTLTVGSFDAVTLGTETAGVDCDIADFCTALAAAINGDSSAEVTAVADATTVVISWIIPGTVGDGKVTAESGAQSSWGGNLAGGGDCAQADAVTALAALTPRALVSLADGTGDTVLVTALTAGVAGDLIACIESMANGAFDDVTLGTKVAGVDGTVGLKGEFRWDSTNVYVCILANTIADANWVSATLASY